MHAYRKSIALLLPLMVSVAGCATIIEGPSQNLTVNTTPSGATCDLKRAGAALTTIAQTPGNVNIDKTREDILIACKKPGYESATYVNKSDVAGVTFINIPTGGLFGLVIDWATGSYNKYNSVTNITLPKSNTK